MSVLAALIAALAYGLSDFVGGVASRRASVWPVGLLACVGGSLGSLIIAVSNSGHPSTADLLWSLVAGVGSGTGTAFLYRGLAAGRMGVVAPLSAVGAVVIPLVVGVLEGDRPAPTGWIGIAVALPGIWFVSREPDASGTAGAAGAAGLADGIAAGVGFGLSFAALGQTGAGAGYWPLAAAQAVAVLTLAVTALAFGGDPLPRQRADWWGLVPGVLATIALLFFVQATRHGLLSIAAVITSLYPAVTVVLALGVLRERIHRVQTLGLALCTVAVVLVSLA